MEEAEKRSQQIEWRPNKFTTEFGRNDTVAKGKKGRGKERKGEEGCPVKWQYIHTDVIGFARE